MKKLVLLSKYRFIIEKKRKEEIYESKESLDETDWVRVS